LFANIVFEALTEKFNSVFRSLSGRGKITEANVSDAMHEVRKALLEADVNYHVVKKFCKDVTDAAIGAEVIKSLHPGQVMVKIVSDKLTELMGPVDSNVYFVSPSPTVILLAGLQGCGKTTTAAKLAKYIVEKKTKKTLLVADDLQRPAAVEQLIALGQQINIDVYSENSKDPVRVAENAVSHARRNGYEVVILDTAGRLHIDEELMQELAEIKKKISPQEVLLVADAMTGQDAVRVADEFNQRVGLTGLILTKADGDARGGAAISIRSVTGVPIKFLGVGEKTDALEPFHPDRLASRILGMGDVLSLIEKAEAALDQEQALAMGRKLAEGEFDLEDFRRQLREVKKMGPLSQLLDMIPGFSKISPQVSPEITDQQMKRIEAIINSMTLEERHDPKIINASRKRRIARGSGTTVQEINQLLGQFRQMQRMMKQLTSGRGLGLLSMFR